MKGRGWAREVRGLLVSSHGAASAAGERSRLTVNERLIREQDRERARELLRVSVLGVALLAPMLLYVWQQVAFVETAYEVEELQSDRAELERLLRKARMERTSLETPDRIERLARRRLGMQSPPPEAVVVVSMGSTAAKDGAAGKETAR